MYINLFNLCFGFLFILGTIVLVILIRVLINLFSFLARINGLFKRNKKNMDEILVSLPKVTENFVELSDTLKAVGEMSSETYKHLDGYIDVFMNILKIVKLVFAKKK